MTFLRSLNYLDLYALVQVGEKPVKDMLEWVPSAAEVPDGGGAADNDHHHISARRPPE